MLSRQARFFSYKKMLEKILKLLKKNNLIKIVELIQVNLSNRDLYHEIRKTQYKRNEENHKAYLKKKKNQCQKIK